MAPNKNGWKIVGIIALIMANLPGCMDFDNPVEHEPEASGAVAVEVTGIDHKATVLVVELNWQEIGKVGGEVLRKTVPIGDTGQEYDSGQNEALSPEMSFVFDGLGAGVVNARAGTYVGTLIWQQPVESPNVQLEEKGSTTLAIDLRKADGDLDFEFDKDFDGPDGDFDKDKDDKDAGGAEDGGERDSEGPGDGDGEGVAAEDDRPGPGDLDMDEADFGLPEDVIDVLFTYVPTNLDGAIDTEVEWASALDNAVEIQTGLADPTLLYAMQDGSLLMLGFYIPNIPGDAEDQDHIKLSFDPDFAEAGDEFYLEYFRQTGAITCLPIVGTTCDQLPNGNPIWSAKQSESVTPFSWSVELVIQFDSVGITGGESKTIGFAATSVDNNESYAWPDRDVNHQEPSTWGALTSSHNWDVPPEPDGDYEADTIDYDPAQGDEDMDRQPDGDLDDDRPEMPDREMDADLFDSIDDLDTGEIEEGDPGFCTPGVIYCRKKASFWHARQCNPEGTAFITDVRCYDYNGCTLDQCVPGYGCNYPSNDGAPCDDGNYCTDPDTCSGGGCTGTPIICDDGNECTIDIANPADPECCSTMNVLDGTPCTDDFECTESSECLDGECVGVAWPPGCCEGHPEMMYIEDLGDYCIDRYEAVIATQDFAEAGCEEGVGRRYGENGPGGDDYPAGFPDTVNQANQTEPLYACVNITDPVNILPSRWMTYYQAKTACENSGKRLCDQAEWELSCAGDPADDFPYGPTYDPQTCNGAEYAPPEISIRGCGEATGCVREGVFDLSGNLEEWTQQFKACGGSFISSGSPENPGEDLMCSACKPTENPNPLDTKETRGFRCCTDRDW